MILTTSTLKNQKMNKFYTTISFTILFIFSINCIGQKLLQEGNRWNVYYPPTFDPNYSTSIFSVGNDTILDGESYHKLMLKQNETGSESIFNNTYLREDTTKKVFIKYGDAPESVLYDFGMELGDTIANSFYCSMKVVAIDSVQLNNGEARKRYQFEGIESAYNTTYWIEGIGSILGLDSHFFNFCLFDVPAQLLCFYQNEELLYPANPPSCFLTDIDELDEVDFKIYPNPFHDKIIIENANKTFTEVMIYNTMGQMVKQIKFKSSKVEISLAEIEQGIYYLALADEKGMMHTTRIIHQ